MAGERPRVGPAPALPFLRGIAGGGQVVVRQLGEDLLDRVPVRPALQQLGPEARPPLAFGLSRFHEVPDRGAIIEVPLGPQPVEGRFDFLRRMVTALELGRQLPPEMGPDGEELDGLLVGLQFCSSSKLRSPPSRSLSPPPSCSDSSIWSREMSAVNCTPWILSRNSSGLEARFKASSSVIRPLL